MEIRKRNKVIYIDNFSLIIQNIPFILQYFLPGYWGVMLFSFLNSKKINDKMVVMLSCLFSYFSITVISLFYQIDNVLMLSGVSFIVLTILSILISLVYASKLCTNLLVKLFHKTQYNDIWHDILDYDKGSNLKIYLKNDNVGFIGHFIVHEEKENDSWFAISAPIKFDVETDSIIDDENKNDENYIVTFRLSDVKHIEIF